MTKTMVDVQGLRVRIGKRTILDDVSLRFGKGEAILIAGPNGSGKSTFLKCLAGVILPDRGKVGFPNGTTAKKVGFISDQLSLFENFSVRQAMDFHKRIFGLKQMEYGVFAEAGMDESRKIRHLSTGERTLLNLSLALSQQPDLLLIDEIIHVIDPYLREKFLEAVIDLMDRCFTTVVFVNHTFSEVEKIPERVLVMADGRFILDERAEELGMRLKKVVAESEISSELSSIFSQPAGPFIEYFIYPFGPEMSDRFPYEFQAVDLNEIIKAFIGGQYVQKRNP
jgi:ABC-type multidrug transport system ATPase subunit